MHNEGFEHSDCEVCDSYQGKKVIEEVQVW
jgi:hypothetical protein